jgi:hypothetical protein
MKPDVAAHLQLVEGWLQQRPDGSHDLLPEHVDALSALLHQYLPTTELAAFIHGLLGIAERHLQASESDPAAAAILALLERPEVLEPFSALVEAVRHYKLHHTTITPEMDNQMRGGLFRAVLNASHEGDLMSEGRRRNAETGSGSTAGGTGARVKIFLSHSSADKEIARRLALDLQAANAEVWLDQWQIGVGDAFAQRIQQGLDETDFVLVLLTRSSVASEWVNREWREKIDQEAHTHRVAVVPVRAEVCEIPDFLAQRSHADISGGSYLLGFRHLLQLLRHHGSETTLQRPDAAVAAEAERRMAHLLDMERRCLGLAEPAQALQLMLPITVPITLEIAQDLFPSFLPDDQGRSRVLDELVPAMRSALQAQFGFPFPGIRILGNMSDMPPGTALVLIDEIPERLVCVDQKLAAVLAPVEQLSALNIAAQVWPDPASDGHWSGIAMADRDAAEAAGLSCMDAAEYVISVLHRELQRHAASFLDIDVVCRLVEELETAEPELVARTLRCLPSWMALTEVLRGLLDENVGIGRLGAVLEAIAQSELVAGQVSGQPSGQVGAWVEQARHALCTQITASFAAPGEALRVLRTDAQVERLFGSALQHTRAGSYLALSPDHTQAVLGAVRVQMEGLGRSAAGVVLLVDDPAIRPYLRRLVRMEFPALHVLSTQDLSAGTPVQVVARFSVPVDGESAP